LSQHQQYQQKKDKMTHGSLFSGIGGFDLAAEWMGWQNAFHCEWNDFGQKVLKYYWPNAESFTDITKTNFRKYENKIDVLTGGFPCQPYSLAGKRKGKDDERHLWPEMCRAIREIKPRWIVGENVYGLVNWSDGLVFDEVQTDLENEGYEVQPFLLPAAAVNAPHRRDRIWFIAHAVSQCTRSSELRPVRRANETTDKKGAQTFYNAAGSNGVEGAPTNADSIRQHRITNEKQTSKRGINAFGKPDKSFTNGNAADAECSRLEYGNETRNIPGKERKTFIERGEFTNDFKTNGNAEKTEWINFPTVAPICAGNDGLSAGLDGITFSKWRKESIKAGGNAIVPQVAYQIFLTIQEYENLNLGTEVTEQQ
jgi:DNA (cytosine-5)-methyltransferase 1